ncbi:polysaccharide biosynthesis protein [Streptomyces olivaceiscleroticus]|uniref:polysaccharide biosynthesis protein n=1 Tax=Streptomyces olivaceiscleroticus TaxID=68245 RepID=UPI0031F9DA07
MSKTTPSRAAEPCRPPDAETLLARPSWPLRTGEEESLLRGRRVLVTGAGGTIGGALARRAVDCGAGPVFLLDQDECALHSTVLALNGRGFHENDRALLADIRDAARMQRLFRRTRPEIVYHAAALKHLPLLERNPAEAVKTNVLGTRNLVDAALQTGVERFTLVSTDKAADPASVLGATKRLAEEVLRAGAAQGARRIAFASVRFGNVLGSRGSFLGTVLEQLRRGLPITVTDPEATRFFMTVSEAVSLLIQASAMASHGEVYSLDMGEPIRIIQLVERLAALQGISVPPVRVTGLQPGEKLREELVGAQELRNPTAHPRIWNLGLKPVQPDLAQRLDELRAAAEQGHRKALIRTLGELFDTYRLPAEPPAPPAGTTTPAPWAALRPTGTTAPRTGATAPRKEPPRIRRELIPEPGGVTPAPVAVHPERTMTTAPAAAAEW